LEFNVPFQHKYGYIRDERRDGKLSVPSEVKEGYTFEEFLIVSQLIRKMFCSIRDGLFIMQIYNGN